jgi:hypothetical protein
VTRKLRWIIDRRSPTAFVDREALVPADERVVLVQPQRREVHDVDRGGWGRSAGQRPAVEEGDVEVPGQSVDQVHRAHQVAEPHECWQ